MENYLITIVGPTAVGKTNMAVEVAKHFQTSVLSADSRQFFKEMSIGTAKPTKEEMQGVPHYFVDSHSIHEEYSMGHFERECIDKVEELFPEQNPLVLCGGTGLYVQAVLEGIDDMPILDPSIRATLMARLETEGLKKLQEELKALDPVHFSRMDTQNTQRVVRALEVCLGTGKPFSSFMTKKKVERNFTPIKIGLEMERPVLYDRINRRVDLMMEAGLLEEAKGLYPYREHNALKTVGYREFFDLMDGETPDLETAVELLKRNSRRYAKRQLTWFKRDSETEWFNPKDLKGVIAYCEQKMGL